MNNYSVKWAYNHISDKEKQIYIRLFNAASSYSTGAVNIADLNATEDELYEAFWAFDYDNPQFLELGSGYSYSYSPMDVPRIMKTVTIAYNRTSSGVSQGKFDRIAQSVLANAQTQSSDYEKLKYVHDWIVNNTVYLNTGNYYDTEADGPLIYGNAICEGYSKAFMYFAQSMGFECVCAIGNAGGVDHMWNMVKLNGKWYHVDVTWDDPIRSDGKQVLRYDYFLKSDTEIKRDHVINSPFTLPKAPNSYA